MDDARSIDRVVVVAGAESEEILSAVREQAASLGVAIDEVPLAALREEGIERVPEGARIVAVVGDADIAEVVMVACLRGASLGIVPNESGTRVASLCRLPKSLEERCALAFGAEAQAIDLLLCNGEPALGLVTIGDVPFLDRARDQPGLRAALRRLRTAARAILAIRPFAVRVTVGEEKTRTTALVGGVVLENDVDHPAARLLDSDVSVQDGMTTAVLVAPTSIVGYVALLARTLVHRVGRVRSMPQAISWAKSRLVSFEADRPISYQVDGRSRLASTIELRLEPGAVRVAVSEAYRERHAAEPEEKDTVRFANLPTGEDRIALIRRHLPLFRRAAEDEFKDLFRLLHEGATVGPDYLVLVVLSCIVATLGLFLPSAAVIIGAMVLAPLMSPIIALSMGLLRMSSELRRKSLVAIGVGVGLSLAVSATIAAIVPLERLTDEMAARLQPSLLDLGVAVFSGVAGAYVTSRETVLKSLPGVAIAVALMPPLCVAGIGIGWLEPRVFFGAALLFVTNLVGIELAASLTFLVLGFAPIRMATRGIVLGLAGLALVAVPLSLSFRDIWDVWTIEKAIREAPVVANGKTLELRGVRATLERPRVRVEAVVASEAAVDRADAAAVKEELTRRLGRPVDLELELRLVP